MHVAGHGTEHGAPETLALGSVLQGSALNLAETTRQRLVIAGGILVVVHWGLPYLTAYGAAVAIGFGCGISHPISFAMFLILVVVLAVALDDFGSHKSKCCLVQIRVALVKTP